MPDILLLNPNTSEATTAMMVAIARDAAPAGHRVTGVSAARGVPMILSAEQLAAAGHEVVESWRRHAGHVDGIVISAFGDPGIEMLRALTGVPVVGICEASIMEAARDGRRFGIATVTPQLVEPIDAKVQELGFGRQYTGIRLTSGDPQALAADAQALEDGLAGAITQCVEFDRAQAVVIGGGPLGQAAIGLAARFPVPVIAPIPAAMRRLIELLERAAAQQAAGDIPER